MKTVKEVVDDYKRRQCNLIYEQLIFETNHGADREFFNNVRNIYRDKCPINELSLDNSTHEYQLEMYVEESVVFGSGPHWEQVTFTGKLVRFSQIVEK